MEHQTPTKKSRMRPRRALRWLITANLLAALLLLTVLAVVLRALGLLDSIFAFFF